MSNTATIAEFKTARFLSASVDANGVRVMSYGTGDAPALFVRQDPITGCSVADAWGFGKRMFPTLAAAVAYAVERASC